MLFRLNVVLVLGLLLSVNVSAADVAAGKKAYATKGCVGCHGIAGDSKVTIYPVLKAKPAEFLQEQMTAFRDGTRKNPIMNGMAASLSDADIKNMAAYLSSQ